MARLAQMDQLMEEDAGNDVLRRTVEAKRDSYRAITRCARSPALAHLPPTNCTGTLVKIRQVIAHELFGHGPELVITAAALLFTAQNAGNHLGDERVFIAAGEAIWNMDFDNAILAVGTHAAGPSGASDHAKIGQVGREFR